MLADLKRLWLRPAFKTLLIARIISNFGNGLGPIALAFGVLGLDGATASSLSIVMAAQLGVVAWIVTMGVTNWIPLIMISAFFAGIALDFFMVLWQTAMQSNIPRESLSRVSSYDAFGSLALAPIGLIVAGPLTEKFGSSTTLIAMGVIFVAVLAAMLAVPAVRQLEGKTAESTENLPETLNS